MVKYSNYYWCTGPELYDNLLILLLSCHNLSLLKKCLPFTSDAYIQVHFRLDFFMEANSMSRQNPDQTAPKGQFDLGPYCLQNRLLENISR